MIIYKGIFNIKNKSYQIINLAQIYYQLYYLIKLKTFSLYSKSFYSIHTYNKLFNNKVNYYFISIILYHKIYIISRIINQIFGHNNIIKDKYINYNISLDINLNTDLNMYIKTNTGPITINQLLFQTLLFINTQKIHTI